MIRISLGNPGSGKTLAEVREMVINKTRRKTYSNIQTNLSNQKNIDASMIIKEELQSYKKNKLTGQNEAIMKYALNDTYWKKIKEPINVVLDEAHSIINSRRSMSKINIIVTEWIALVRRVLGSSEAGFGELVFITQLPNRIDLIARDMATQVRYHICHYWKSCKSCSSNWHETSEDPEPRFSCPVCGSHEIKKGRFSIELFHFKSMDLFNGWKNYGMKSYYNHYFLKDVERYFNVYDSLQWDNMFSKYY